MADSYPERQREAGVLRALLAQPRGMWSVAVVHGAAGGGKTSVVRSVVASSGVAHAWCSALAPSPIADLCRALPGTRDAHPRRPCDTVRSLLRHLRGVDASASPLVVVVVDDAGSGDSAAGLLRLPDLYASCCSGPGVDLRVVVVCKAPPSDTQRMGPVLLPFAPYGREQVTAIVARMLGQVQGLRAAEYVRCVVQLCASETTYNPCKVFAVAAAHLSSFLELLENSKTRTHTLTPFAASVAAISKFIDLYGRKQKDNAAAKPNLSLSPKAVRLLVAAYMASHTTAGGQGLGGAQLKNVILKESKQFSVLRMLMVERSLFADDDKFFAFSWSCTWCSQ
eukprot:m51a1_g1320 hypothetical protein (338) ;mRNA; r:249250-250444